jgi:hypothetical protein
MRKNAGLTHPDNHNDKSKYNVLGKTFQLRTEKNMEPKMFRTLIDFIARKC